MADQEARRLTPGLDEVLQFRLTQTVTADMAHAAEFDIVTATKDAMMHKVAARVIEAGRSMANASVRIEEHYCKTNPEWDEDEEHEMWVDCEPGDPEWELLQISVKVLA